MQINSVTTDGSPEASVDEKRQLLEKKLKAQGRLCPVSKRFLHAKNSVAYFEYELGDDGACTGYVVVHGSAVWDLQKNRDFLLNKVETGEMEIVYLDGRKLFSKSAEKQAAGSGHWHLAR